MGGHGVRGTRAPLLAGTMSACVALGLLAWWALRDPAPPIVRFEPGLDNRRAGTSVAGAVVIGQFFEPGDGTPSLVSGSWAGFRGPDSRNIASSQTPLADSWPVGGPSEWPSFTSMPERTHDCSSNNCVQACHALTR